VVVAIALFGSAASSSQPIVAVPPILHGAFGRQIVFYPFDSVQSASYPARFAYTTSDVVVPNSREVDPFRQLPLSEAIYQHNSTVGLIASGIIIKATTQAEQTPPNNQSLLGQQRTDIDSSRCGYFVVTGHLFELFSAPNTAPIFRVAIYHRIAPGQRYLGNNLAVATAGATGLEFLVDSFDVTKGEMLGTWPYQVMHEHRDISHRTDLYWRPYDNGPGPLHPSQPNGREQALDIRVYWTGAEKAALRSVAYRDSLGELVLGRSQASLDYRENLVRQARQLLDAAATVAPSEVIPLSELQLEPTRGNAACSTAVTWLLREVMLERKSQLRQ